MSEDISRGEFDMLKTQANSLERRIESIDDHGTRGVGILQAQIVELLKDITDLKTSLVTFISEHSRTHKEESNDRTNGRRWMVGTAIAGVMALTAILTVVVLIYQHTGK